MQILFIEGDMAACLNMRRKPMERSFPVESVPLDGEGIELARSYGYDLIPLDLDLPHLGAGCWLLKRSMQRQQAPANGVCGE